MSAMIGLLGMSILEYDAENNTYINFLLSKDEFSVVLHICIPLGFPKEPPKVSFQSIYHMVSPNETFCEDFGKYPYYPGWPVYKMCTKLLQHVTEHVKKFKRKSIEKFN